jgi:hypothetical protein
MARQLIALLAFVVAAPAALAAQGSATSGMVATITTQSGSVKLPGVSLTVTAGSGRIVASAVSDDEGLCRLPGLTPGVYEVRAALQGLDDAMARVRVEPGRDVTVRLDLAVSRISDHVEVIGGRDAAPPSVAAGLGDRGVLNSRTIDDLPIAGNNVLGALQLFAGIINGPGGMSIEGGRSNQSGLQIGMAAQTDSATGTPLFLLPAGAVDSIEFLPNPYAVEFGRFSSGVTVINTKRAAEAWRAALNTPDFSLRQRRGAPWALDGVQSFSPRASAGGPLIKERLFLEESAQATYQVSDVISRPADQTRVTTALSSFSRLDATVSPRESITGTVNLFSSSTTDATLNTFNSPDVAADLHNALLTGNIVARSTLSSGLVAESTVQVTRFDINVGGHGTAPMVLAPSGNSGNFFNRQRRATGTLQWAEVATWAPAWSGAPHLFRFGFDVIRSALDGTSNSSTVDVRRDDGTLARRLVFNGPASQTVASTDVAAFAQDRVQPASRLLLEFGGRVDRDGVLGRTNATPRVGAVWLLNKQGSALLRGGFGLFYERTPLVVGGFDHFETTTDTRYGEDGVTVARSPVVFTHAVSPDLGTARSATWNVSYEQRVTPAWSFHAGVLDRQGHRELIVEPVVPVVNTMSGEWLLTSAGRSSYRAADVTVRYAPRPALDVNATYVRSSASANLNAYATFFDNIRWPIIGTDAYAPTSSNAPHRFIAHARALVGERWLLSSIVEVHSGFPYSAVNAMLDWAGARNQAYHLPTVALVDVGVERKVKFFRWRPFVGLRVYNALNAFAPSEVQANLSSAAFGSFYNSQPRRFRVQVNFFR